MDRAVTGAGVWLHSTKGSTFENSSIENVHGDGINGDYTVDLLIFGDPLNFQSGKYSKPSLWVGDGELEEPPPGYYRLLFGRAPMHTFGRTTNNRLLSEVHAENAVWVNPRVARKWGLRNGDRVHLENQDGVRSTFTAPVKVTERIRPDAVYLVHGYGRKAAGLRFAHGRGIDDAELVTRYRTDPIMGGTGMNVNFVTFVPAGEEVAG